MKCNTCKMKRVCNELERMGKVPKHEKCRCYSPTKPTTNADRIRDMTDEELAEWLYKMRERLTCIPDIQIEKCAKATDCKKCYLEWVRKEADQ